MSLAKGSTLIAGIPEIDQSVVQNSVNAVSGGAVYAYNANRNYDNAGAHNSIFRGKYLGTEVTADQYNAIDAGAFDDLFIGDYWTINNVNYRIAHFDYWLHKGDTECATHHAVIVPDSNLYTAKMNDSNVVTGGYAGSKMYTTNLADAKTTINTAFNSSHILNHREMLTNAVTSDKASGWTWFASTVELMNEVMVYGTNAWASAPNYEVGIDYPQLALFRLAPEFICNRARWWLRCVMSSTGFASVNGDGHANRNDASDPVGVRPAFGICKANPS